MAPPVCGLSDDERVMNASAGAVVRRREQGDC